MSTDTSVKTASFDELRKAWPAAGHKELVKAAGAEVADAASALTDDSSVRLSLAFNIIGHPITRSTTFSGKEVHDRTGHPVIVDAEEMKRYLQSKLGKPRHMKSQSEALGRKGIIYFEGVKGSAHGHVDLWDGKDLATIEDPWNECSNIFLWEC